MHPVNATQESCFTAAGWSHYCNDVIFWNVHAYVLHHMVIAKVSIKLLAAYNCTFHLFVISFVVMFNSSTQINKISEAPQARSCHSSYGLVA